MVEPVRKRMLKPLVYVLVAAQLLLAVPAMSANTFSGAASSHSAPCDADPCPCCPDGAASMKDCLASCTLAAVAAFTTPVLLHAAVPAPRVDATPSAPLHSLSDPPLKPPPIR